MLVFESGALEQDFILQVHQFEKEFSEPAATFLNSEELAYYETLTSDKRKIEYLQSRFALKNLLSAQMRLAPNVIQFKKVGEGKPVLMNPTVHLDFNLSHSHDYFAIALSSKGEVGVDIEQIRPPHRLTQIAERFFSPAETDLIQQESDPAKQSEIFAKFWSGKEALVKTVAGGVFKNVHQVLIDEITWKIKKLPLEFGNLSDWNLKFFDAVAGYTCSVAFKSLKVPF